MLERTSAEAFTGLSDPHYMIMLIKILGPGFIVWDKVATIRFRKPGRSTLFARFVISEDEIETIKKLTADGQSVDRNYTVDLVDDAGVPHVTVDKMVYIRRKNAPTRIS